MQRQQDEESPVTNSALIINPQAELTPAERYLQERINQPYNRKNAYTNSKSWQQILCALTFLVQLILHSVLIAPFIYQIDSELLSFYFIFNYIILLGIIGHYLYLTIYDPVDSLITNNEQKEMVLKNSANETVFCIMCQKVTKKTSYHCYHCGRCTEEYDHHCKCLNNCIGMVNYQEFIRMLLFLIVYNILIVIQTIWILSQESEILEHEGKTGQDENNNRGWNILLLIISFVFLGLIGLLLAFHAYLNCRLKLTTFEFFRNWRGQQYSIGDKFNYKKYLKEVNPTADSKGETKESGNQNQNGRSEKELQKITAI